jgi:hypothetical protein
MSRVGRANRTTPVSMASRRGVRGHWSLPTTLAPSQVQKPEMTTSAHMQGDADPARGGHRHLSGLSTT